MSAIGPHLKEAVERAKLLASKMTTISPGIKRSATRICGADSTDYTTGSDLKSFKRSRSSEDQPSLSSSSSSSSITSSPTSSSSMIKIEKVIAYSPNHLSEDANTVVVKTTITTTVEEQQKHVNSIQEDQIVANMSSSSSKEQDQNENHELATDKSSGLAMGTITHDQYVASLNHTHFNDSILPQSDLLIPQQFVGLVIGKGGENIRRVQNETGATLYIDSSKMVDGEGNKLCTITGSVDSVQRASALVQDIIESAKVGRQTLRRKINDGELEYRMKVPAAKTGVIIGRGGDTIRAIRQQTQCTIELDKDSIDCGPEEKVFVIMGMSERVQQAQELINARLASCLQTRPSSHQTRQQPTCSPNMSSQSSAALQYGNNLYSAYWQQHMAAQSAQHDPSAAWAAYYAQYYAFQMQIANLGSTQEKKKSCDSVGQKTDNEKTSNQPNSYDYSSQWAQYYRAQGMIKEAEWIEQQLN